VAGEAFCDGCTGQLRTWLGDIPALFADVVNPPDAPPTGRDPLTAILPAGPISGPSRAPRVTGSTDAAVPARFNEQAGGTTAVKGWVDADGIRHVWADDQIGDPPPAVVLDSWARDWQRSFGFPLPAPTVPLLCRWLLARLPWALGHHPAIAEFFGDIAGLHRRLWIEAGREERIRSEDIACRAVPCKSCDQANLWRRPDGSGDVECHTCRRVYRAVEYQTWVRLAAAFSKRSHLELVKAIADRYPATCRNCGTTDVEVEAVMLIRGQRDAATAVLDCRCEVTETLHADTISPIGTA